VPACPPVKTGYEKTLRLFEGGSHTESQTMTRRKMSLERTTQAAAIRLSVCVGVVLGLSCLLLQSTVWNQPPAAPEPFYRTIPDVDTSALAPEKLEGLLKEWNARGCNCGCLRTVASCRNNHTACTLSLSIADAGVAAARLPGHH
jgi:hypothetical protein